MLLTIFDLSVACIILIGWCWHFLTLQINCIRWEKTEALEHHWLYQGNTLSPLVCAMIVDIFYSVIRIANYQSSNHLLLRVRNLLCHYLWCNSALGNSEASDSAGVLWSCLVTVITKLLPFKLKKDSDWPTPFPIILHAEGLPCKVFWSIFLTFFGKNIFMKVQFSEKGGGWSQKELTNSRFCHWARASEGSINIFCLLHHKINWEKHPIS